MCHMPINTHADSRGGARAQPASKLRAGSAAGANSAPHDRSCGLGCGLLCKLGRVLDCGLGWLRALWRFAAARRRCTLSVTVTLTVGGDSSMMVGWQWGGSGVARKMNILCRHYAPCPDRKAF